MKPFKDKEVESLMKYYISMSQRGDLLVGEKEKYLEKTENLRKRL
jgi:hypothetical protein